MVSHADLTMYLVAVRSLYSHLGHGQIIILNDGTLTAPDIAILKRQLCDPEIVTIADIENQRCPHRGCWERLLLISDRVRNQYVLQLDSDTLTLGKIPEVIDAVQNNRSFVLGTGMGRQISAMEKVCVQMKAFTKSSVQVTSEKNFDRLPTYRGLRYVRGSAAFVGFAMGCFTRLQLEEFSADMEKIIGQQWQKWGSEQVASNVMVANAPQSFVLPYPKYCSFAPDVPHEEASFMHFIGTHRFTKGVYVRRGKETVRALKAASV
jgi:hypothetical protein